MNLFQAQTELPRSLSRESICTLLNLTDDELDHAIGTGDIAKPHKIGRVERWSRVDILPLLAGEATILPDRLYSSEDAARLINVSLQQLQNWRSSSQGPAFVKCGRYVNYQGKDLLMHLERSRVDPNAKAR